MEFERTMKIKGSVLNRLLSWRFVDIYRLTVVFDSLCGSPVKLVLMNVSHNSMPVETSSRKPRTASTRVVSSKG